MQIININDTQGKHATIKLPYHILKLLVTASLREKCPYSEFFWSVFFRSWTEYGDILRISLYSVRMRENMDQKNSEYGHFSRNAYDLQNTKLPKTGMKFIKNTKATTSVMNTYQKLNFQKRLSSTSLTMATG